MPQKLTLKQARCLVGLNQQQIAEKLGVSVLTYRAYEKGRREMKISTAQKFSDLVQISLEKLIF